MYDIPFLIRSNGFKALIIAYHRDFQPEIKSTSVFDTLKYAKFSQKQSLRFRLSAVNSDSATTSSTGDKSNPSSGGGSQNAVTHLMAGPNQVWHWPSSLTQLNLAFSSKISKCFQKSVTSADIRSYTVSGYPVLHQTSCFKIKLCKKDWNKNKPR